MKGYMYILECADGSYYTESTNNLELRISQHQNGEGANHTKKRLPVKLVYFEEYQRIDEAFYREKQVQGWSRKKKEALIKNTPEDLKKLAECMNESHYKNYKGGFGSDSGGFDPAQPPLGIAAFDYAQAAIDLRCLSVADDTVEENNKKTGAEPDITVVSTPLNHRKSKPEALDTGVEPEFGELSRVVEAPSSKPNNNSTILKKLWV